MKEYKAGTLAFFDSFVGCVPCKVIEVTTEGDGTRGNGKILVEISRDFKGYKKGERLNWPSHMVLPRKHLVKRGIYLRINTLYRWIK